VQPLQARATFSTGRRASGGTAWTEHGRERQTQCDQKFCEKRRPVLSKNRPKMESN
jgi:hypothetical protein